jgi:hypothetical protein
LIPREAGSRSIATGRSEGGGVEVNGSKKRMATACSEVGEVEVDSLRKRTVTTRPEVGVKAAVCSEAEDEAAVWSGAGIEDGRW